jgi:hypothetical protein
VSLLASNLRLRPISIARDGADGCFVITGEIDASNQEIALRLHHVDTTGTLTSAVVLEMGQGVWFYDAFAIQSVPGSCIVVWSNPAWGARLKAQRFDSNCSPLWTSIVNLSTATHGFSAVAAASDGSSGAVIAFLENASGIASTQSFRVQCVDKDGNLPWGSSGTVLIGPGPSASFPASQPQVVTGSGEFAVLWQGFFLGVSGPIAVNAAWIDGAGQLLQSSFVAGNTFEIWDGGKHTAVADFAGGGFYVSLVQLSSLQLLRFERRARSSAWTTSVQQPILPQAYSLAEDGGGGALLASIGNGGVVSVARFDRTGANLWWSAPAMSAATISFGLPPGAPVPGTWGGVVAVAPKPTGGAILVYPDWVSSIESHLNSQCFDEFGDLIGQPRPLSSALGTQEWPRVTDQLDAAAITMLPSPGSAFLPGTVICAWEGESGASGSSISLQKLGCCTSTHWPIPQLPGWMVPNWPRPYPGTVFVSFSALSGSERYGVIPLPNLAEIPNVHSPGSLLTVGVDAPEWIRIWLGNVPDDVSVDIWTHTGERAAGAETVAGSAQGKTALNAMRTLTFRPSAELSYLLRFRRPRRSTESSALPVRVRIEFGLGDTPPSPTARTEAVNSESTGAPGRKRQRTTKASAKKGRRR